MTTPSISVRNLGANNDPLNGNGRADFLTDLAAVGQIVTTRLKLFQGEWWVATNDGLPLWQSILGAPAGEANQEQIALLITSRILGSPYVVGVSQVKTSFNAASRAFTYYAVVNTSFGQLTVTNFPVPPSKALPQ